MCMAANYEAIPYSLFERGNNLIEKKRVTSLTEEEALELKQIGEYIWSIDTDYFDVLDAPMPPIVEEKWGEEIRSYKS